MFFVIGASGGSAHADVMLQRSLELGVVSLIHADFLGDGEGSKATVRPFDVGNLALLGEG